MKIKIENYKYPKLSEPSTTNIVDMDNKLAVKHLIEFLKDLTTEDLIAIEKVK